MMVWLTENLWNLLVGSSVLLAWDSVCAICCPVRAAATAAGGVSIRESIRTAAENGETYKFKTNAAAFSGMRGADVGFCVGFGLLGGVRCDMMGVGVRG